MAIFFRTRIISFLLVLGLFVTLMPDIVCAAEPLKESELYAKACVLMDGESGRILYGKNESLPLANASTTKILTCITALEYGDLEGVAEASANACGQPKVHLGMQVGEQFYVRDLLYGLMLESYNDCAVAIAEYISGTVEDFAALMNKKAEEIGCKNSYFITPNGLDAQNEKGMHHTTAEDLCRIMKYCVWESEKSGEFLNITQTREYSFCDFSGKTYNCRNHNAFITMMDGVLSGKTGFTGNAGYCYVAALEQDKKRYCIALLACGWPNNRSYKWSDAKKLFTYGISNFERKNIFLPPKLKKRVIENGFCKGMTLKDWGKPVTITPVLGKEEELELPYLIGQEDQVRISVSIKQEISPPFALDTVIGKVSVLLNGKPVKGYPVYAGKKLERWTFSRLFSCLIHYFFFAESS